MVVNGGVGASWPSIGDMSSFLPFSLFFLGEKEKFTVQYVGGDRCRLRGGCCRTFGFQKVCAAVAAFLAAIAA